MEQRNGWDGEAERRLEEAVLSDCQLSEREERRAVLEPLLAAKDHDNKIPRSVERQRLASLDIFRGLAIALMILVDEGGGEWPVINHSPWNGVTLADFVMPFFLFIVGVSTSLAYKRIPSKTVATSKTISRAVKLFLLGIFLQGGYFHALNDLGYGVDIARIRWCGILQRIALGYLIVALCEIWNPRRSSLSLPDGSLAILNKYFWHWVVAGLLSIFYLVLLYGLYVPDWEFTPSLPQPAPVLKVKCGVRGDTSPACNAVGFVDRYLLGLNHLYAKPMYRRTKDCSVNSPDYGPPPVGAPNWCQAPFDPEGLLSSVSAVGSCFIGLHYGHVLVHLTSHRSRVIHWTLPSLGLMGVGTALHYLGMPLNKPLYSLSYVCLTAGAAGMILVALYIIADIYGVRWTTLLLEWMGKNSLLIFVLAACGVLPAAIQGFYWHTPENNLVTYIEEHGPWHNGLSRHKILGVLEEFQVDYLEEHLFQSLVSSERVAKLLYILSEIVLWCLVAGALHAKGIFWKF